MFCFEARHGGDDGALAKSGDDLMRWQSIIARAEGGGAAGRKHTLSINKACWVSQRAVRLVNGK